MMDKCRECFGKIRNPSIDHLKSTCFFIGWFRLCCRVVLSALFIVLQLGLIDDRPNMFGFMFSITLTSYCIFTLSINIMFLYGIKKEKPTMILMFVDVEGFEIIMMIVYIVFGSPLTKFVGFNFAFWSYLPLNLILLAASFVSFIYSFQLYQAIHKKIFEQTV